MRKYLTEEEIDTVYEVINSHPDAGPSQLITGLPTLTGNSRSIVDIAPALANKGRLGHIRREFKANAPAARGGDRFISDWQSFYNEHSEIIKHHAFEAYSIVTLQTPWMAEQSLNATELKSEANFNGFVSDAAHKFFENGALLIVTSAYSSPLQKWVPVLVSYSSNNTKECHKMHFKILFDGLRQEMEKCGRQLEPHHINMVCF